MGSKLSIQNDESAPVRGELWTKTGSLLEKAHIPQGHIWTLKTKKLVAMMPYEVVVVDDTGLRWRLNFNAPSSSGSTRIFKVSEIEDGEFLAPVKPPRFPSKLDPGVSLFEENKLRNENEAYTVPGATETPGPQQPGKTNGVHTRSDEAEFEASRRRAKEDLETSYTTIGLTNSRRPTETFRVVADMDVQGRGEDFNAEEIILEEPQENKDHHKPPQNEIESSQKIQGYSKTTTAALAMPVMVGGVFGAAVAGPFGYWLGSSAIAFIAPVAAGAILGGISGAVSTTCASSCGSLGKKYEPVLPE
mmetsp:Transcript_28776/g.40132  ORF Transcript_28776/g.40132 Transcript_28776/m.40132 type:complete len:304 (-) Transcript_28776:130-1041(-)|eukprot:CAMPEP_0185269562 /NCGR_PEP_ID=MMETSP1359-20130426/40200_1 /TAXON_ID=552665 /ORGANISM="Bigelowiella longifila, Strain CCMP242" /LENGTH=303 /DNA_ID=CAMNT_0027860785 /DNA_START=41 /DNA_END=952 /DNA_ORIENTATION=-